MFSITNYNLTMNKGFKGLVTAALCVFACTAANIQAPAAKPSEDKTRIEIQAEFRMPFYRNPKSADLTVIIPQNGPKYAYVELFDQNENRIKKERFKLLPGENSCEIKKIGGLEQGRYPVVVTVGDKVMKRMLRVERIPEIEPAQGAITARKILFTPDEYLFSSISKNLQVKLSEPEVSEAWYCRSRDAVYVTGGGFYRAEDGSYIIEGTEYPYKKFNLYGSPARPFILKSNMPDGPYVQVKQAPACDKECFEPLFESFPVMGSAKLSGQYEMYDPEKHGTYSLSDIAMVQNIDPYDYGCVQAGYRTYWTVAVTSTGDTVFLSDKPVFRDVPEYQGDLYDDGFMTNDNFGNFWYNADSTELYLLRGQTVRRSAPYDVPYDLLPNCSRIVTVYKTKDGKEWECCHSMVADGPDDTPFTQQYGSNIVYLPEAQIYLVYVSRYNGDAQTATLDLAYSRNGVDFFPFPGNRRGFAGTDDWNDAHFGGIYAVDRNVIRDGDRYYQFILSMLQYPHMFAEALFKQDYRDRVTAKDYESAFEGRGLAERLPYFEAIGGWQGLTENLQKGHSSVGILSYRADGWFSLVAGGKPGKFTTNPIAGGGALTVNAEVAEDGYLTVELVKNGRKVKSVNIEGDGVDIPAFDIPSGNYRIRVKMRNAKLYAFNIH